jgi:hypothetical protein
MQIAKLLVLAVCTAAMTRVVWADESEIRTRYKCEVDAGREVKTRYLQMETLDLGDHWSWRSAGNCATALLESNLFAGSANSPLFPKKLPVPPRNWKLTFDLTYGGNEAYAKGVSSVRYHVMPQRASTDVYELRVDAKFDLVRLRGGAVLWGEEALIRYAPQTGELLSYSVRTKNYSGGYRATITLTPCTQAAAQCAGETL